MSNILIARVYMTESEHHLESVLKVLHDDVKVAHITVFRGIEGFEKGGKVQASKFLSLSLSLPLVVEFFDAPERIEQATEKIKELIGDVRIITFSGSLE